ncbi:MAG: DUF5996 family protein, partial [Flavobacteriaceae bacterium]
MKKNHNWPELNFVELQETLETLHQWIQIVGKIRLRTMPWQNHSWHTALYITARGFSTHAIPFAENTVNSSYDPKAANTIWQAMLKANNVFNHFRTDFIGKCSP